MKTDELRRALDDLAGEDPEVEAAFANVSVRARKQRNHFRVGLVAAVVLLAVAVTSVSATQFGSNDHRVSVVHNSPAIGDINDLGWKRVAAPMNVVRIVTANGKTYALGSSADGLPKISELDATGEVVSSVDPTADYDVPVRSGSVNDLVGVPGALIAVGQSVGTDWTRDAWRSTDGGHTWQGSRIETTPAPGNDSTMIRVLASKGRIYAVGAPFQPPTTGSGFPVGACPTSVWASKDGTDFHLDTAAAACGSAVDAATGPNGVVINAGDATAWTQSGDEWSPHPIPAALSEPNARVRAVDGNDEGYVAVGSFRENPNNPNHLRGAIWWSPDGREWTRVATNVSPAGPSYALAEFTSVAHSAAGWAAAGVQMHPGGGPSDMDAVLWTSPDGRHWTENTRDHGVFAQHATTEVVGATANGFAIFGSANVSGTGAPRDPTRQGGVLWLGSYSSETSNPGTIEGTMRMIGGLGVNRGIDGTLTATATDGREITAAISGGRFSVQLPAGTYNVVGHSPQYGDGEYDCVTRAGPTIVRSNLVSQVELICSIG